MNNNNYIEVFDEPIKQLKIIDGKLVAISENHIATINTQKMEVDSKS